MRKSRGSHEKEVATVTALNKAPPSNKLKSVKKASTKARDTTKAIKSVSTTPPRPSCNRVPSVTPEASDLPKVIVTATPSVTLDLEDSKSNFENCFDLDKSNDTLDKDEIDDEVQRIIDNSSSTDIEPDDESSMSPNKSHAGDSVTTISKATLECIQNEKKELNEQLGLQLKANKEAKAEIESLKKALHDISSSEDGTAKSAEYALKISDLTSQLSTLQAQYDEYLANTNQEIEALKKERPDGDGTAGAAALQKLKKRNQELAKQLKVAQNEIGFYEKQNKSLKASLTKSKGKDGGIELQHSLNKTKKALAEESKAKQALQRDLRASQKANAELRKELDNAKAGNDGDVPEDSKQRIYDLEQDLIAASTFRERARDNMKEAVKERDAALKMCDDLRQSNEAKRLKLEECYKVLREKGKAILAEVSPQVKQAARTELKEVVFRKVKIVNTKSKDGVEDLMKMVYNGIKEERMFEAKTLPNSTQKNPDYLTFDDFQRIYHKDLLQYFSTLCSTVQTACKEAVMGKPLLFKP